MSQNLTITAEQVLASAERIREDIDAFLSAEEGKYVKLLTSVRELYKSRALRIEQNGF